MYIVLVRVVSLTSLPLSLSLNLLLFLPLHLCRMLVVLAGLAVGAALYFKSQSGEEQDM